MKRWNYEFVCVSDACETIVVLDASRCVPSWCSQFVQGGPWSGDPVCWFGYPHRGWESPIVLLNIRRSCYESVGFLGMVMNFFSPNYLFVLQRGKFLGHSPFMIVDQQSKITEPWASTCMDWAQKYSLSSQLDVYQSSLCLYGRMIRSTYDTRLRVQGLVPPSSSSKKMSDSVFIFTLEFGEWGKCYDNLCDGSYPLNGLSMFVSCWQCQIRFFPILQANGLSIWFRPLLQAHSETLSGEPLAESCIKSSFLLVNSRIFEWLGWNDSNVKGLLWCL